MSDLPRGALSLAAGSRIHSRRGMGAERTAHFNLGRRAAAAPREGMSPRGGGSAVQAVSTVRKFTVRIERVLIVVPSWLPFAWEQLLAATGVPLVEHLYYETSAPKALLCPIFPRILVLVFHALAVVFEIRQRRARRKERRGDEKAAKKLLRHPLPTFRVSPDCSIAPRRQARRTRGPAEAFQTKLSFHFNSLSFLVLKWDRNVPAIEQRLIVRGRLSSRPQQRLNSCHGVRGRAVCFVGAQ
jgi:hypothetical protein